MSLVQVSGGTSISLRELWLLVCALNGLGVAQSVLSVELHSNLVVSSATIKRSRLDAGHVWHDFELGVQAAAAVGAELVMMLVKGDQR